MRIKPSLTGDSSEYHRFYRVNFFACSIIFVYVVYS